jgi:hypothetical protein
LFIAKESGRPTQSVCRAAAAACAIKQHQARQGEKQDDSLRAPTCVLAAGRFGGPVNDDNAYFPKERLREKENRIAVRQKRIGIITGFRVLHQSALRGLSTD